MRQVIDFGSSCYETDQLYVYVQSRYYRAPEASISSVCLRVELMQLNHGHAI